MIWRLAIFVVILGVLGLAIFINPSKKPMAEERLTLPDADSSSPCPIRYSVGFEVSYEKGCKVITVTNPWKKADCIFRYLLVSKEKQVPEGYEDAMLVRTPIEKMVLLSSTHLPLAVMLGIEDKVVGFTKLEDLTETFVPYREKGQLVSVGTITNPDMETLLSISPDIVMTYGSGNPEKDAFPKILELGIPVAINAEYMEAHPLGRLEWLKFMALFFDLEKKATEEFDLIRKRYEELAKRVRNLPRKPTALCGNKYGSSFFAPGGNSYMAQFLKDAGADYVWKDDETIGSQCLDVEVVIAKGQEAQFWIMNGLYQNLDELKKAIPQTEFIRAVVEKNVFSSNRPMAGKNFNDYWTRGLANPDQVLADMIRIFHPKKAPTGQFQWYQKLPEN